MTASLSTPSILQTLPAFGATPPPWQTVLPAHTVLPNEGNSAQATAEPETPTKPATWGRTAQLLQGLHINDVQATQQVASFWHKMNLGDPVSQATPTNPHHSTVADSSAKITPPKADTSSGSSSGVTGATRIPIYSDIPSGNQQSLFFDFPSALATTATAAQESSFPSATIPNASSSGWLGMPTNHTELQDLSLPTPPVLIRIPQLGPIRCRIRRRRWRWLCRALFTLAAAPLLSLFGFLAWQLFQPPRGEVTPRLSTLIGLSTARTAFADEQFQQQADWMPETAQLDPLRWLGEANSPATLVEANLPEEPQPQTIEADWMNKTEPDVTVEVEAIEIIELP